MFSLHSHKRLFGSFQSKI